MKSFQFYWDVPKGEETAYKQQTKRQLAGLAVVALFLALFMGLLIVTTLLLVAIG